MLARRSPPLPPVGPEKEPPRPEEARGVGVEIEEYVDPPVTPGTAALATAAKAAAAADAKAWLGRRFIEAESLDGPALPAAWPLLAGTASGKFVKELCTERAW